MGVGPSSRRRVALPAGEAVPQLPFAFLELFVARAGVRYIFPPMLHGRKYGESPSITVKLLYSFALFSWMASDYTANRQTGFP